MKRIQSEIFLSLMSITLIYSAPGFSLSAIDPNCDAVTGDNPAIPKIISVKLSEPSPKKYAFYFQRKYVLKNGGEKKLIFKVTSDDANEEKLMLFRRLDKESKGLNWLMQKNLGDKPSTEPPQLIAWPNDESDTNNHPYDHSEMREKFCTNSRVSMN